MDVRYSSGVHTGITNIVKLNFTHHKKIEYFTPFCPYGELKETTTAKKFENPI